MNDHNPDESDEAFELMRRVFEALDQWVVLARSATRPFRFTMVGRKEASREGRLLGRRTHTAKLREPLIAVATSEERNTQKESERKTHMG